MLSEADWEREREEARLRVQRDESIRANAARIYYETGFKEGLEKGSKNVLVEMIQRCQRHLKRVETIREELLGMSAEQLQTMAKELQRESFGL